MVGRDDFGFDHKENPLMTNDLKKGVLRGFRRASAVGAVPGVLDRGPLPISSKCRITRISFNTDNADEEIIDTVAELNEEVPAERVYWFRLEGVADTETLQELGEAFGLHPLALEDVVNTHQRCKVEDYASDCRCRGLYRSERYRTTPNLPESLCH